MTSKNVRSSGGCSYVCMGYGLWLSTARLNDSCRTFPGHQLLHVEVESPLNSSFCNCRFSWILEYYVCAWNYPMLLTVCTHTTVTKLSMRTMWYTTHRCEFQITLATITIRISSRWYLRYVYSFLHFILKSRVARASSVTGRFESVQTWWGVVPSP